VGIDRANLISSPPRGHVFCSGGLIGRATRFLQPPPREDSAAARPLNFFIFPVDSGTIFAYLYVIIAVAAVRVVPRAVSAAAPGVFFGPPLSLYASAIRTAERSHS